MFISLFVSVRLVFMIPDSVEYRPLPFSAKELDAIEASFPGEFVKGSEATEERFRSEAGKFDILHLATHAVTDESNPLRSKLVFSKSIGPEDGFLYAYEIYNLRLNARMTVLSACNTGTGRIVRGEGVMSLARSFAYAGCPSLVMSLWSIDDKATEIIIGKFYEGLARGLPKDEALREAKLFLMNSSEPRYRNPYYWAGLVHVGDPSPLGPIPVKTSTIWPWIVVTVLAIAGFAVPILNKNRRRSDGIRPEPNELS